MLNLSSIRGAAVTSYLVYNIWLVPKAGLGYQYIYWILRPTYMSDETGELKKGVDVSK